MYMEQVLQRLRALLACHAMHAVQTPVCTRCLHTGGVYTIVIDI